MSINCKIRKTFFKYLTIILPHDTFVEYSTVELLSKENEMYHNLMLLTKYAKKFGHSRIRKLGINDTEYNICKFLNFHSDVHQDLISTVLVIDKTTIAKAINNLVEEGFLTREQDLNNRRRNKLNITVLGKDKISSTITIYDEWLEKLASCLTKHDQEMLEICLEKLVTKAKELEGNLEL